VVASRRGARDARRRSASARKPKTALLRREAIRFDAAAITMRSLDHPRIIRTFAYAPPLREKIEKKLETGGYRYRDRVKNRYRPGTGVALAIRGKPSKRVREPRKRE